MAIEIRDLTSYTKCNTKVGHIDHNRNASSGVQHLSSCVNVVLLCLFSLQPLSLGMCCSVSLSHTLYVGRWHTAEHLSAS